MPLPYLNVLHYTQSIVVSVCVRVSMRMYARVHVDHQSDDRCQNQIKYRN